MSFRPLRSTINDRPNIYTYPSVVTNAATSITSTDATGDGTVIDSGSSPLTEVGFVWSVNPQPTLLDDNAGQLTSDIGNFTLSLSPLLPSTLYHYRAYAVNSAGLVSYGDDVEFTTNAAAAAVTIRLLASTGVG